MHFPFCEKNRLYVRKKAARFKTRPPAVEYILLGGLMCIQTNATRPKAIDGWMDGWIDRWTDR